MTKLFAAWPDVKLAIADAQQDNSKQVAQVETFIRQKPDLLIVAPNERAALQGRAAGEEQLSDPDLDAGRRAVMQEYGEATCLTLPLRFGETPVGLLRLYELARERRFAGSRRRQLRTE